ncbi:MAG: hypothetical protein IKT40_09010 [Bacilli bacterium]|nr:hypothetical protein [Bacilli bacterium]
MSYNFELNRELKELNKEKISTELSLDRERERLAEMFKNGLGRDIDNVLSGKEVVKLNFFEKIKYKIKNFLDNLFNVL